MSVLTLSSQESYDTNHLYCSLTIQAMVFNCLLNIYVTICRQCCPQPSTQKLLFTVSKWECRDYWLLNVLRKGHGWCSALSRTFIRPSLQSLQRSQTNNTKNAKTLRMGRMVAGYCPLSMRATTTKTIEQLWFPALALHKPSSINIQSTMADLSIEPTPPCSLLKNAGKG